jgi:hypothetical protein
MPYDIRYFLGIMDGAIRYHDPDDVAFLLRQATAAKLINF